MTNKKKTDNKIKNKVNKTNLKRFFSFYNKVLYKANRLSRLHKVSAKRSTSLGEIHLSCLAFDVNKVQTNKLA